MIKVKTNPMKYKDSNGNMIDVGGVIGKEVTDLTLTKSNVPADSKTVGDKLNKLSEEIADLGGVTDYVVTEAESVLARVIEAQGNRTFNVPVITDLHNNGGASDAQITHACQGIDYIADRIKTNALACLGDHTDYDGSNWEKCLRDIIDCNSRKHKVRNVDYLEVPGNHDYSANRSHLTSKLISAFSTDVVWGDKFGGYFHKDYEDDKVRVIGVNTSEIAWIGVSPEQYRWFIETLNLSDKEDADEWQILIISHVPLDYDTFTIFSYVLDAYVKGTSWTDGTYSCDYTGKNQAIIIACVHGHIHNFLAERMYLGNPTVSSEKINVWRIAIPEVTELYSNHYSAPWKHETTYSKVADTAKDTSFNVLCIDLDSKKIEAICYGAGVDRTINYTVFDGQETPDTPDIPSGGYTNQIPISTDVDGSIYNGIGYKQNVRLNSSGNETALSGYMATGFIPFKPGDDLQTGGTITNQIVGDTYCYLAFYDSGKNKIVSIAMAESNLNANGITNNNGYLEYHLSSSVAGDYANIAFVRLSANMNGGDGSDFIVTVNEEIV